MGTLAKFPEQGREVPEIGHPDVREMTYGNYRVLCRIEGRRVCILTVTHGRRLLDPGDLTGDL